MNSDLVREWHERFDVPILPIPTMPSLEIRRLRIGLIAEELDEFRLACDEGDIFGAAQELADLLYVTYGAALTFGIPIDAVFAEVHRSNMTKLTPGGHVLRREDGKILKGPRYVPPDIYGILYR